MPLTQAQSFVFTQPNPGAGSLPSTYRADINVTSPAGVSVEIRGSSSTIVYITKISLYLAASDTVVIDKRSTNSTGGTSTAATLVPLDSANGAATNSILEYTVAPTAGTLVGALSAFTGTAVSYTFGDDNSRQFLTLRTAAQAVTVSLTTGTTITGYIEWFEI